MGWGATCQRERTVGPWTLEEAEFHINYLKLLASAAFLTIRMFARRSLTVYIQLDSVTAQTYINEKGGTRSPSLSQLAKRVWSWCMERDISLAVADPRGGEHSGVMNIQVRWDWKLNPRLFSLIHQKFGPLEIDLFASRVSTQPPRFFSWRLD